MSLRVIDANVDDGPALMALLPRLGAFPRPEHRLRDAIHTSDARVLERWLEGNEPQCHVLVARDDDESPGLLGFVLLRMQTDVFTGEPSAHLEALAVAENAEGKGVGSALLARAESHAIDAGATSITLHVFETNERAIALYERKGFVPEWIRYFKPLHHPD